MQCHSSTFHRTSSPIRNTCDMNASNTPGYTRVALPHEEAMKAYFHPGCKVLCFSENRIRIGVVRNVLVSISLSKQNTFETYYEVDMKETENPRDTITTSILTASELRLTPDCPVQVNSKYFGLEANSDEKEGKIQGKILGSFEIPSSLCSQCSKKTEKSQNSSNFFYSVRVKFQDEVIEAHGVSPQHVTPISYNIEKSFGDSTKKSTNKIDSQRQPCVIPKEMQFYDNSINRKAKNDSVQGTPTNSFKVLPHKNDESPYLDKMVDKFRSYLRNKNNCCDDLQINDTEQFKKRSDDQLKVLVKSKVKMHMDKLNQSDNMEQRNEHNFMTDRERSHFTNLNSTKGGEKDRGREGNYNTDHNEITIRKETTREVKNEAEVGPIGGENNTPKRTIVKKTIPGVDSKLLQSQNTNFRSVSPERKLARNLTPKVVQNTEAQPISVAVTLNSEEGCYLFFDPSSGGRFITQFSHSRLSNAIGFWSPGEGKKLPAFKFKQNQGRSDLMKDIAGKNYKRKYLSAWCQFVKAARSYNGHLYKQSENERLEVDIYVFFCNTNEIMQINDGELSDVSKIDAISCVLKNTDTFAGVKTGELGTFLNKGNQAGAAMSA